MKHRFLHTRIERLEAAVFRDGDLYTFRLKSGEIHVLSRNEFYQAWEDYRHDRNSYLCHIIRDSILNEYQQRWRQLCDAIRNPVLT